MTKTKLYMAFKAVSYLLAGTAVIGIFSYLIVEKINDKHNEVVAREVYAENVLRLENELSKLTKSTNDLLAQKEQMKNKLIEISAEIEQNKVEIADLNSKIDGLNAKIADLNAEKQKLDKEIANLKKQIEILDTKLLGKDKELSELKTKIRNLENENIQNHKSISDLNKRIQDDIEATNKLLKEKNIILEKNSKLQNQISQLQNLSPKLIRAILNRETVAHSVIQIYFRTVPTANNRYKENIFTIKSGNFSETYYVVPNKNFPVYSKTIDDLFRSEFLYYKAVTETQQTITTNWNRTDYSKWTIVCEKF